MKDSIDLKPCPFCGCIDLLVCSHDNSSDNIIYNGALPDDTYSIECQGCFIDTDHFKSKEALHEFWNRRSYV